MGCGACGRHSASFVLACAFAFATLSQLVCVCVCVCVCVVRLISSRRVCVCARARACVRACGCVRATRCFWRPVSCHRRALFHQHCTCFVVALVSLTKGLCVCRPGAVLPKSRHVRRRCSMRFPLRYCPRGCSSRVSGLRCVSLFRPFPCTSVWLSVLQHTSRARRRVSPSAPFPRCDGGVWDTPPGGMPCTRDAAAACTVKSRFSGRAAPWRRGGV